jgi:hypothetical protein
MHVCILDAAGNVLVHEDMAAAPEAFLKVIAPYRDDLVVAVECIFTWYWRLTRDRNELDEPLLDSSLLLDWSATRAQMCFSAVQRHRLRTRSSLPSAAEPR